MTTTEFLKRKSAASSEHGRRLKEGCSDGTSASAAYRDHDEAKQTSGAPPRDSSPEPALSNVEGARNDDQGFSFETMDFDTA
jgi:hypothetical protein